MKIEEKKSYALHRSFIIEKSRVFELLFRAKKITSLEKYLHFVLRRPRSIVVSTFSLSVHSEQYTRSVLPHSLRPDFFKGGSPSSLALAHTTNDDRTARFRPIFRARPWKHSIYKEKDTHTHTRKSRGREKAATAVYHGLHMPSSSLTGCWPPGDGDGMPTATSLPA